MYAQVMQFEGPRSAELIAAGERAHRERIEPAVSAHPELMDDLIAVLVLQQPNGGQLTIVIAETEEALRRGNEVVRSTELLPGEDAALLTGPDRFETYEVVHTMLGKATLH